MEECKGLTISNFINNQILGNQMKNQVLENHPNSYQKDIKSYFHDENNDRKLDTNIFGSPIEGYGFSNNAEPNFGPASFEDMAFSVNDGNEQVKNTSTVIYK